jgi:hypothetical protein
METTTAISAVEVKKELYKSKVNAKLSHYEKPSLYYTVDLSDGKYMFPIAVIQKRTITIMDGDEVLSIFDTEKSSPDLSGASFGIEVKASDLNRWIEKSIKEETFIKIASI